MLVASRISSAIEKRLQAHNVDYLEANGNFYFWNLLRLVSAQLSSAEICKNNLKLNASFARQFMVQKHSSSDYQQNKLVSGKIKFPSFRI